MKKNFLLVVAGFCGLVTSSHSSLVAWYKFDEDAGTTMAVDSVSGSNGVLSVSNPGSGGAITSGVSGISGNAYQFTRGTGTASGGLVDMGDASFFSSITTSGQLTMSAWIKTSNTGSTRNTIIFAGDDTMNQTYVDLGYIGSTTGATAGQAYVRDRPNNISSGTGVTGIYTSSAVNNDNWNFLTLTVDISTNSVVKLYLNGMLQSTMTVPASGGILLPTLNNFEIGRLGRSAPTDYFTGLIDDVQIYNSALTSEEINWLYNNPGAAVVPEPGTVALVGFGLCFLYAASRRRERLRKQV